MIDFTPDSAATYLLEKGFRQSHRLNWLKPYKEYAPTDQDIAAIDLLCEVWDQGNLAGYIMQNGKAMEFVFIIDVPKSL